MATQVMGYPLETNFCPKCGSPNIISRDMCHMDGRMECKECGAVAYVIEGDD